MSVQSESIIYHHRQFQPWWGLMIIVSVVLLIIVFYMAITWIFTIILLIVAALFWGLTGIKWTPHGWMWNISGLDAIELTYHDGKKFRIGTDEPEALLEALKVV